jgi:hypothetical protein
LAGFCKRRCTLGRWCGRRDLNPHGPFKPCGFSYRLRLSPPRRDALRKLTPGLRSGLSLHPTPEIPKLRCCPSSLYTFPGWNFSGLGSGLPFKVSPNLSSSASPVSQTSTQVFLKSAAYAIPPRPRAAADSTSIIGQIRQDLHVRRHRFPIRLLKNSVPGRFWEGHDFSRAVRPSKINRALAPEDRFLLWRRVFQQPARDQS